MLGGGRELGRRRRAGEGNGGWSPVGQGSGEVLDRRGVDRDRAAAAMERGRDVMGGSGMGRTWGRSALGGYMDLLPDFYTYLLWRVYGLRRNRNERAPLNLQVSLTPNANHKYFR